MNGEIRISTSFSAPRIVMGDDEEESLEPSRLFSSTHSLLARPEGNNNAACASSVENLSSQRSHLETQRLSPPLPTLMPSQLRPHSNSVCTSLLMPDAPKRTQLMHRASDGLLMSDTLREQHERRTSQMRNSSVVDQDLYWKANEARHRSNILTTPLASYIFVFISILLTFSIVFAVGYLISSMTYRGKLPLRPTSLNYNNTNFNPTSSNFPTQSSKMAAEQVRILTYNTTNEEITPSRLFFLPTNLQNNQL